MGGLEGPPKPPALGSAPAQPWRSSILRCVLGLEGPPTPPALGSAPAQPWRSSILRCVLGLEGLDSAQFPITSPPSTLSAWPVM